MSGRRRARRNAKRKRQRWIRKRGGMLFLAQFRARLGIGLAYPPSITPLSPLAAVEWQPTQFAYTGNR